MARPLRVDIEDGIYHVVTRGVDRNDLFRSDSDRKHWLNIMEGAVERFRLRLLAYVLMDNHVHLILQTPEANLSRAIQWIKVSYSMWFNAKYKRVGPLFHGRFKSVLVDSHEGWLLDLSLYVHLNPVRLQKLGLGKSEKKMEAAGFRQASKDEVIKRMAALRSYRWSSYRYYAGYARSIPDWLDMREVLLRCPKELPLKFYREEARRKISSGHSPAFLESLTNGFALGGSVFMERLRKLSGEPSREVTGKRELRSKVSWERLVQVAEEVRGESWELFGSRRGDVGRAVVFRLARQFCGITLKEIGLAAGGVDYAAVSDRIRRYEKQSKPSEMETGMVSILNLET